ncbi:SIS domain-containing protein [Actinomadura luteofluorescens]|uniref:SIS domain-containing protein n=1 Tax=Actinomadura luteofluorescens TaxID=46163 RepID=UPI00363BE4CF
MTAAVTEVFRRRAAPGAALAGEAGAIAAACHAMAARFHAGGRLLTFGTGAAATDAQHVAVEFVHPVIVGKRALPALSLTGDVATLTGVGAARGSTRCSPTRSAASAARTTSRSGSRRTAAAAASCAPWSAPGTAAC